MQLNFAGRNIEITPALKEHATEKFFAIAKRFDHITTVLFTFNIENITHTAEATVHFNGNEIHATAESDDMYKAIDSVVEKLLNQMTKLKEKIIDSHRQ